MCMCIYTYIDAGTWTQASFTVLWYKPPSGPTWDPHKSGGDGGSKDPSGANL